MGPTPPTDGAAETEGPTPRPVPAVVDWIVAALLAVAGIATALGGLAVTLGIDRSDVRRAIRDEEVETEGLTEAEAVDVADAAVTWIGWGLLVVGLLLVAAGVAYAVHRRRVERRRAAGEAVNDLLANAVVGAGVTIVVSFVPFSQVVGGGAAGYLEHDAGDRPVAAGALSGLLSVVPGALLFAVGAVGAMAGLASIGEVGIGLGVAALVVIGVAMMAGFAAGLGAVGGLIGGKIAEDRAGEDGDRTDE